VVHFRPARASKTNFTFKFNETELCTVPIYKYLGVYFDEHLSFYDNAVNLSAAASRALGLIRFKLKYLKECSCTTFTKLYTSCVCPIIDYGAEVWGTKTFNITEQVQYKALRYFLGVHRFTPIDVLLGESGWLSVFTRHKLASIRLWNRLVNLPATRLTNIIFLWDIEHFSKPNTWPSHIKSIFEEISHENIFQNLVSCDLELAYEALRSNEIISWEHRRSTKPKLRYYNMYKAGYDQEEYLNLNISKRQRSLYAQFRAGILPLQVEIGRYRNTNLEDRICTLCTQNIVEDEYHVLCVCESYQEYRYVLYNKASSYFDNFYQLHNIDKFVLLNSNMQKEVIYFLDQALSKRRENIYSRI
jgi:hypothetical protein